jgi:hypothetical protein
MHFKPDVAFKFLASPLRLAQHVLRLLERTQDLYLHVFEVSRSVQHHLQILGPVSKLLSGLLIKSDLPSSEQLEVSVKTHLILI